MAEKIIWSTKDEIIWKNVQQLADSNGWNYAELARRAGTTPQNIQKIKKHTRGIGRLLQKKFASAFGIDEGELLLQNLVPIPERKQKPIPVISWVHAGLFTEGVDMWPVGISEEAEPVFSYVHTGPNAFGLRIKGDSMLPRFIPGDIAIIDPGVHCDNGCACVVSINGEVSLKLFWKYDDKVVLRSMNDKYPEITIKKDSKVDFRVIGKVVDIKAKL